LIVNLTLEQSKPQIQESMIMLFYQKPRSVIFKAFTVYLKLFPKSIIEEYGSQVQNIAVMV
jgi:hypothetical protein